MYRCIGGEMDRRWIEVWFVLINSLLHRYWSKLCFTYLYYCYGHWKFGNSMASWNHPLAPLDLHKVHMRRLQYWQLTVSSWNPWPRWSTTNVASTSTTSGSSLQPGPTKWASFIAKMTMNNDWQSFKGCQIFWRNPNVKLISSFDSNLFSAEIIH